MNQESCWNAVVAKDASRDGTFVVGVITTGIYCRPSCPARRPLRKNVAFYSTCEEAERAGLRACLRCKPKEPDWVSEVCRYLEHRAGEKAPLAELAQHFGLSAFHLQRRFKDRTGLSPRQYQEALRMGRLKESLKSGGSVTDAIYEAGFGASSRMYEQAPALGMTPSQYRKGAAGSRLHFTIVPTRLGLMLVAATEKGLACVRFGDQREQLQQELRAEYPGAELSESGELNLYVEALYEQIEHGRPAVALPLDVQATAFQMRVWKALQGIPSGETRTYSQVAAEMGHAKATRAVARACATNPVAVVVPCHRVVPTAGGVGGYRWGSARKQALLEREKGLS